MKITIKYDLLYHVVISKADMKNITDRNKV